jgi:pimeloyl-ACP methyl ester carboxylesterase
VRQAGSGPVVVLLHGLGDSSIGWRFVEPRLIEAGYRAVVWDALGAGRSDKPADGDYSIQAHGARLAKVLDALGTRDAVVVGHSLGGSVALVFARTNRERVRALCLIDPAAYRAGAMGGRWFWNTPLLAEAVLGILPSRTIARFGLKQNFHDHNRISKKAEAMYVREARRDGAVRALIAQERQLVPDDPEKWERGHRAIRQPTLILWGKEDKLIPAAQGERLRKDIKDSRLTVLPGVGHSPHLEAPGLVVQHLLAFLEETCQK